MGYKKHDTKKVGDVVNGWKIIEIFFEDKKTKARVVSVLPNVKKERVYTLTQICAGKIGWPDRRRPDVMVKNKTHGLTYHTLYSTYNGIKNRCYNKNQPGYKNYGAKGITMCDEWKTDFKKFYDWCMNNGWEEKLSIDRIDNNKGYFPDNCRFCTTKEQNDKRNISVNITAFGETKPASDWSLDERCKTSYHSLIYRIKNGWLPEKAISTRSRKNKNHDNFRRYKELYFFIKEKHPEIIKAFLS